jgi:uncharacterized membrane protein
LTSGGDRGGWSSFRDTFRTQLWPIPAGGVVIAAAAGVLLPRLDAAVDDDLPGAVTDYLFGGGAAAARAVLETIAGSLITVTSLTFSLTVVTLQLASSQYSPRLLRTFSSDRFVQATLALLLGTFTYALTVLRTVRIALDDQRLFVPQMAVTVAFVLAVVSVLGLVLFLAHLAKEIRVETMLANVHRDATDTLHRVLPEVDSAGDVAGPLPQRPAHAAILTASSSGFLVRVDEPALLAAAVRADAILVIDRPPGSSLVANTPIGVCWPLSGRSFDGDALKTLRSKVAQAVRTGKERTAAGDVGFGLRQLTDVAIKALSPGINDPTTAVHALGHSSSLLCELASRDLAPRLLRDEAGTIRVALNRASFGDLLELAVGQPRRYGAADPDVLSRLFQLLHEIAWTAPQDGQRQAIAGQLARLRATTVGADFDPTERAHLASLGLRVEQRLSRHHGPSLIAPVGAPEGDEPCRSAT